jgi:hypothetical protein
LQAWKGLRIVALSGLFVFVGRSFIVLAAPLCICRRRKNKNRNKNITKSLLVSLRPRETSVSYAAIKTADRQQIDSHKDSCLYRSVMGVVYSYSYGGDRPFS